MNLNMKKIIISLIAILAITVSANAGNYTVNDEAIDALIEAAAEVSPLEMMPMTSVPVSSAAISEGNPTPVASFILCTFLGGFGVHRHYMGTRPFMWGIYTLTFGGIFGIVPFVDWVMLLIGLAENDITKYCGNTKFFMWA